MLHLNGNIICAIDCETTGLKAGYHEIVQICVLPLGYDLTPLNRNNIFPFYTEFKPLCTDRIDWDAIKISRLDMSQLILRGLDPDRARDIFDAWVQKLKLPYEKKIIPLGCNWIFDCEFVKDWLGNEMFNQYFYNSYRDVQVAAQYINDKFDFFCEPIPFPKINLRYLATSLKLKYDGAHDALHDCIATAEVYRRMLRHADYLHIPDELSKRLKPFIKQGENAIDCLDRILKNLPREK